MNRLDADQQQRMQESLSLCHAALDQLTRAIDLFPVVGDAELHLMRMDLRSLEKRLRVFRDNGVELLGEIRT